MEISDRLASALDRLVAAAGAAQDAPSDRQAARRAIEAATVTALVARDEGFGPERAGSP